MTGHHAPEYERLIEAAKVIVTEVGIGAADLPLMATLEDAIALVVGDLSLEDFDELAAGGGQDEGA